jgi:IMP dehydrogenase
MLNPRAGYTFDDVLLVPRHSEIKNRKDVNTSVNFGKGINLAIPIVSANMKNVTESTMAKKLNHMGGLPILHRFYNSRKEYMADFAAAAYICEENVGVSFGVNERDFIDYFMNDNNAPPPKVICVDIAHGDSKSCAETTEYIAKKYPDVLLISGNVATKAGARTLYNAGANVIKVGIGPGSLCTTRLETGNGVPQLTALADVYEYSLGTDTGSGRGFKIIADGGISKAGDIVKALCFSDAVMLGNLLAGTDEAPGHVIKGLDDKLYKEYVGSSTHKQDHIEGVSALVPYRGPVDNVIESLMQGLKSGMSYQNAANLEELREDPEFVSISNAGLIESKPHSVLLR